VIVIEDPLYWSQDIVAFFKNLLRKTPACPKYEEIRLRTVVEKLTHFLKGDGPVLPGGTGCHGSDLASMPFRYLLGHFPKRGPHPDPIKGPSTNRIVTGSDPACPMPHDSVNQLPLRVERVNEISDSNAKGTGTPREVVYV